MFTSYFSVSPPIPLEYKLHKDLDLFFFTNKLPTPGLYYMAHDNVK